MSNNVPVSWKHPLERLREDIHHAFDRWRPEWRTRRGEEGFPSPAMSYPGPAVDIEEDEHEVRVTAELPGLSKDDFKVEVLGDQLFLRGEKKISHEERKQTFYYSECSYGAFSRRIPLPSEVQTDKATAEYKHGLLKLRLPKVEKAESRKIEVKVS